MGLKDLLRRRGDRQPRTVVDELEAELRSPIPWMYEWSLAPETTTTVPGELMSVHAARLKIIRPAVQGALVAAGHEATVIDLGCNEGWFAHRALEWGAARVTGVDIRESNLRRARLLRDHFGIPADRLVFERATVHELDPERLGTFDVVLVLGLIYHLEDPVGALRTARRLTRDGGTVVVESQLTAHDKPIRYGWGETDVFREATGHWAAVLEPAVEQADDGNPLASFGGVLSLVPNRAALLQAVEVAGFRGARMLDVPEDVNRQYVDEHRGIATGRA